MSDGVTVIVGSLTIIGIIRHRQQLSLLWHLLSNMMDNEKVKRIKESLGRLDSLAMSKETRAEILSIMGKVAGQIKEFAESDPGVREIYEEIDCYISRKKPLKEPEKQRLDVQSRREVV